MREIKYTLSFGFASGEQTTCRQNGQALVKKEIKEQKREGERERECGKLDKRELQWSTINCDPPTTQISGKTFHFNQIPCLINYCICTWICSGWSDPWQSLASRPLGHLCCRLEKIKLFCDKSSFSMYAD